MKRLMIVVVAVIAVLLALSAAKDNIVKFGVEHGVKAVTGLRLSVSELRVGIIRKQMIAIKDLKLYNPGGFKDKVMLDMPEIYIDYDLPAFFKGKLHFNDVRIDMKEFIVEKNKKGELNLDSLKVTGEDEGEAAPAPGAGEKTEKKAMPLSIDSLNLKVGKVYYKDYSQGTPQVKEYDVGIDEQYSDIKSLKQLISLIMFKALEKTAISQLTNFAMNKFSQNLTGNLTSGSKLLSGTVGKLLQNLEEGLFKK